MVLNTLSGRFLGLMVLFVLIAEVLIFVPAMARFREDYLRNRLEMAQLAALALLTTPEEVGPDLKGELLDTAGVLNVVLRREDVRELVLDVPMTGVVQDTFYIDDASRLEMMGDALRVFVTSGDRIIRVIGLTRQGARSEIEVTLREGALRSAMFDQGRRILLTSLAVSLATAALLFLAVQRLMVRPIRRVVDHMTAFRDDPMDASRIIEPESGARELREAETALRDLEVQLSSALRQKDRLAALGAAVAKISHDLRNMLTTAQLLTDRIEASSDPAVRRTAPKLVGSLARAISLCERTLTFGKAEELPPEPAEAALAPLVVEVLENERAAAAKAGCAGFASEVPPGLIVRADPDQLFRVLSNLVRNAAQAIEAGGRPGAVTVTASAVGDRTEIRVRDSGPGLPQKARDNLFQPFRGSGRPGGSGLGLVIAADLVRGHGGTLVLEETGPRGSTFRISLPAPGALRREG
jgi:signal transduction histidine kinase